MELGKGEPGTDYILPSAQMEKNFWWIRSENSSKAKGNNPRGTTMETPKAKSKMPY